MNTRSINCRLKTALIRRTSEQGFAIPVALGLGLAMLLVGATMMVRSQGNQMTSLAQKNKAQGLSVAEAGVAKVQSFLDRNRYLAIKDFPWSQYLVDSGGVQCTSNPSGLYDEANKLNSLNTIGTGYDKFRVISYAYQTTNTSTNTGEGTLVVEGVARQGTATTDTTSTARIQVKIPVNRNYAPTFPPPGAWAESFRLGNNDFVTDVVIDSGCNTSISPSQQSSNFVPTTPGGTVQVIRDASYGLGTPLAVPSICPAAGSFTLANKPCAISISPVTSSETFPRTNDLTDYPSGTATDLNNQPIYIYYISNGGGSNSVNLGGGDTLTITPGKKVSFYLEGNYNMGGSSELLHNCATALAGTSCVPTDFQIYGGVGTTSVLVRGNSTVDAFIFAPKATGGVDGGGQIRGSIWLNRWDASSANHTVLSQTGGWDNLPVSLRPPNISRTTAWQQVQVP